MTIAQLVADVRGLRRDVDRQEPILRESQQAVGDLKVAIGTLTERVSHLPGKGFIVTAVTLGVGALVGLLTFLSYLGVIGGGGTPTAP